MARISAEASQGLIFENNELVGADPRALSLSAKKALHGPPGPATKAIRAKCLDCCVGNAAEVRRCTAVDCPLWLWRMGKHPWRGKGGDG
jgi:hypothetical protein